MPDSQAVCLGVPLRRQGASSVTRRDACTGGIAALALSQAPRAAVAAPNRKAVTFPNRITLLVAGPEDGRLLQWAEIICASLPQSLPASPDIERRVAGGADGVTGANQFETRVSPDGGTAMLVPGDAALAWLAGDPRARYDAARWLPVMSAVSPGVLCCRIPLHALSRGARVRVAAASPVSAELPAMLALDLLELDLEPVFGISGQAMSQNAVASHAVDAVFLHGKYVPQRTAALAAAGMPPLFCLGIPDDAGGIGRDPLVPTIPSLPELALRLRGATSGGPLYAAWHAASAAAQLEYALVLPELTPPALVATWRQAGTRVAVAQAQSSASGVRTLAMPAASIRASAMTANVAALLMLRQWLSTRLRWQPT
jgi:hypothetical protein